MTNDHCEYCDPEFYVIYGNCPLCQRECEPPLQKIDGIDYWYNSSEGIKRFCDNLKKDQKKFNQELK